MTENLYKENELIEKGLEYFKNDLLSTNVWIKKYALKNKNGQYLELSPEDTIKRITNEIYRIECKYENPLSYEEIYNHLKDFKTFIFGGSILYGIGNNNSKSSLGNCFFINNEADSYGGIFNTDESIAQLMKRRGGVGVTLEHLRPSTAEVNNAAQSSTGAVSFIHRFSNTTREVAQDGRRGALMVTCDIRHPNIDDFIIVKNDLTKVTGANISVKITDEFMKAVEQDQDYILCWPIRDKQPEINEHIVYNKILKINDGSYIKKVKAKELWNSIIKQAHKNAEPGIMFWDKMTNDGPQDMYKNLGFKTMGTNPCISGDTLIAVADGRNAVSIKQLSEEEKDVPVYCLNDKGNIEIQLMRNPRITGYNQPIYEVILDSGDSIKCTGNHKLRLKDESYKEAKYLKYGDSLHISTISYSSIVFNKNKYRWIKSGNKIFGKGLSEHRLIYEYYNNTKINNGFVIHHKDYNSLNNNINNLEMLLKYDHDILHSKNMIGKNNPYYKMSEEARRKFHENSTFPGISNPNYSGISNYKLYKEIILLTKKNKRKITSSEWYNHAKTIKYPAVLNYNFRKGNLMFNRAAIFLKYDYINVDPRTVKRYVKVLQDGYNAKIIDNILLVEKICEECGKVFWTKYNTREHAYCSKTCANLYINKTTNTNIKRTNKINKTYKQKAEKNIQYQLKFYNELKFKLKRDPYIKEWAKICKENNISSRLNTKNGLKNWKELKTYAESYNHKIISVKLCGYENVYNGTVDKYHNFFTVFKKFDKINQFNQYIINQKNCGEVGLNHNGTCILGSINLFSIVDKNFTTNAKINWNRLEKISRISQRLMDDIIDLEEEKINIIIEKIKKDSEDEKIKRNEIDLWINILNTLKNGRRTGLGVLGLGDMFAALGIKYGSKESTNIAEKIQKIIAINSYKESILLAKERGCFPIWNLNLESGNPFITRIISNNFNNEEYNDYTKYGRRNIANISIAPTGTISILAQNTSGIEPVFKIYYRRRRKINPNEEGSKVSYVDQNGDSWEEYNVIHYPFIDWYIHSRKEFFKNLILKDNEIIEDLSFYNILNKFKNMSEENLNKLISESPWAKSESHDIDYLEKINMQGAIQKYVDHSISVTNNLPEKITLQEVNDIYFHGWKVGCKGLTIYREGSRSGVLLTGKEEKSNDFKDSNAPKRPKVLESDYYVAKANGKEFAVIIGLWPNTNKPFEIFAFENPPMNKNTRGKTIKVKKGHYKFINGEFEIDNIQLAAERIEERTLTLSASMLLRHGAPIKHVNNVIKKIDENITSFSSVVRRCLSKYIEEELNGENCPECGEKLIMQDGCVKCLNCTYSKCS